MKTASTIGRHTVLYTHAAAAGTSRLHTLRAMGWQVMLHMMARGMMRMAVTAWRCLACRAVRATLKPPQCRARHRMAIRVVRHLRFRCN